VAKRRKRERKKNKRSKKDVQRRVFCSKKLKSTRSIKKLLDLAAHGRKTEGGPFLKRKNYGSRSEGKSSLWAGGKEGKIERDEALCERGEPGEKKNDTIDAPFEYEEGGKNWTDQQESRALYMSRGAAN